MRQISATLMFLVILIYFMQAYAKPVTRFDAASNTCRVLSSEGPLYWESYPWGEGGKTFKAKCQSCHNGNDKNVPFLWSESKNQNAWNRVFASRYPKCAQNGSWKRIGDEQLRMVNDYLWRFADNVAENVCRG